LVVALLLSSCWSSRPGAEFVGPWFDASGKQVSDGQSSATSPITLLVAAGPAHCGWESIVFLYLAWPLGSTKTPTAGELREFVRDPKGRLSKELQAGLETHAQLPSNAAATGYHKGPWELWISPTDENSVYLVSRDRVERWPRDSTGTGCA
jgi:hypothetical protein